MSFKVDSFSFTLPFGIGGVSVVRTEAQLRAAWSLYVELATRIGTQPLQAREGSAREALDSLRSLFDATRAVLKNEGPAVAEGPDSVGPIAIRILNQGVRPFLVRWHTMLGEFETQERLKQQGLGPGVDPVIDESKWTQRDEFDAELEEFRLGMVEYVAALEELAGLTQAG